MGSTHKIIAILLSCSAIAFIIYQYWRRHSLMAEFRSSANVARDYRFSDVMTSYLSPYVTKLDFNEQRYVAAVEDVQHKLHAKQTSQVDAEKEFNVLQRMRHSREFWQMRIEDSCETRVNTRGRGICFDLLKLRPGDLIFTYLQHGEQLTSSMGQSPSSSSIFPGGKMLNMVGWAARLPVEDYSLPTHVGLILSVPDDIDEIQKQQSLNDEDGLNAGDENEMSRKRRRRRFQCLANIKATELLVSPSWAALPNLSRPFEQGGIVVPLLDILFNCTTSFPYARVMIARLNVNTVAAAAGLQKLIQSRLKDACDIMLSTGLIYSASMLEKATRRHRRDDCCSVLIDRCTGDIFHPTNKNLIITTHIIKSSDDKNSQQSSLSGGGSSNNAFPNPTFSNMLRRHAASFPPLIISRLMENLQKSIDTDCNRFDIISKTMLLLETNNPADDDSNNTKEEERRQQQREWHTIFSLDPNLSTSLRTMSRLNEVMAAVMESDSYTLLCAAEEKNHLSRTVEDYESIVEEDLEMINKRKELNIIRTRINNLRRSLGFMQIASSNVSSWKGVFNEEYLCSSMTYAALEYAGLAIPFSPCHPLLSSTPSGGDVIIPMDLSSTSSRNGAGASIASETSSSIASTTSYQRVNTDGFTTSNGVCSKISDGLATTSDTLNNSNSLSMSSSITNPGVSVIGESSPSSRFRRVHVIHPELLQPHDLLDENFSWMPGIRIEEFIPVYDF